MSDRDLPKTFEETEKKYQENLDKLIDIATDEMAMLKKMHGIMEMLFPVFKSLGERAQQVMSIASLLLEEANNVADKDMNSPIKRTLLDGFLQKTAPQLLTNLENHLKPMKDNWKGISEDDKQSIAAVLEEISAVKESLGQGEGRGR